MPVKAPIPPPQAPAAFPPRRLAPSPVRSPARSVPQPGPGPFPARSVPQPGPGPFPARPFPSPVRSPARSWSVPQPGPFSARARETCPAARPGRSRVLGLQHTGRPRRVSICFAIMNCPAQRRITCKPGFHRAPPGSAHLFNRAAAPAQAAFHGSCCGPQRPEITAAPRTRAGRPARNSLAARAWATGQNAIVRTVAHRRPRHAGTPVASGCLRNPPNQPQDPNQPRLWER